MQKNQVFVTGVAGFIGAETAFQLLEKGCDVVGIDNLNDYYDIRLKRHRLERLKNFKGFSFIEGDIENRETIKNIFDSYKISSVINLAARAGVRYSMENPTIYLTTNTLGLLNILEEMKTHNVDTIVQASTSSLYAGLPLPFTEDLPVNTPISPYATSKKAAEMLCYTYHFLYQFKVNIVRYFTVYGPAGRPDMSILRFINWIDCGEKIKLNGDGTQTRDFTYVTDIAKGTIAALNQASGYDIFNLGGGKTPIAMNDVITLMEKLLGKKALVEHLPAHVADMIDTQANISKAKEILGWEPKVDVHEGIQKSVDWYLQNKNISKLIKY